MAKQNFENNSSLIITEFLSSSDNLISVANTDGLQPLANGDWYIATIVPAGGLGTYEVIRITAINGNTLTVLRGQENTSAQNYLFGSVIELRVTKGTLENLRDYNLPDGTPTGITIDDKIASIDVAIESLHSVRREGAIGDGVARPLSLFFPTLAAAQARYPFVVSLDQSIDYAGIQSAINKWSYSYAPQGQYYLNTGLVFPAGHVLEGSGTDVWDHLHEGITKSMSNGTHLLYYGTGNKNQTCYGVTDMRVSGGVITNPDSINTNDDYYSLENFHNTDASSGVPSTLVPFSAAITVTNGGQNGGIRNLRIVPNFNGINGYIDTNTTGLGDAWDVGVYMQNASFFFMENVQVVGYWRKCALLEISVTQPGQQGESLFCQYNNCVFQGHVGACIRGGDSFKVVAFTATTIDTTWADNHPFLNSGTVSSPSGTYSYTSTTKVGNILRFNGVSPSPVSLGIGNGPVRIPSGLGMGGTSITNSVITGLDHSSFLLSTNPLLGLRPSTALQISGAALRHILLRGVYIQTKEDVVAHYHFIDDLRLLQCQYEANDFRTVVGGSYAPTHGGRVLSSPQDVNNPIPTASGDTSISMSQVHFSPFVDAMPYIARNAASKYSSTTYLFNPRRIHHQDGQFPDSDALDINALLTQDIRFRGVANQSIIHRKTDGNTAFRMTPSGNLSLENSSQLTFTTTAFINAPTGGNMNFREGTTNRLQLFATSGTFTPGADNTQSLGSSTFRWREVFAGTGTINTSDERTKEFIEEIPDSWLDAWAEVRYTRFKFKDSIELKGEDSARWHIGVIAQQIQEAFKKYKLDAFEIGLLCYDEWEDIYEDEYVKQENKILLDNGEYETSYDLVPTGNKILVKKAGNLWGIRADECQFLELALLRRELNKLKKG